MNRKKGIVAMIDILGYSSLMENNDIGENTIKILDLINSIPKEEIESQLLKYDSLENKDTLAIVTNSISYLVFSDTILLTFEIKETENPIRKGLFWAIIFVYLGRLFKKFLENGLPLRGAVSYGEYITRDFCFAGKPIINAYRVGNSLNCAGIILDEYALAEISNRIAEDPEITEALAVNQLKIKLKDKHEEETAFFVAVFLPYSDTERIHLSNQKELTIYLTKSFTAHNKGLTEQAKLKLDNTIDLFEQIFKYKRTN